MGIGIDTTPGYTDLYALAFGETIGAAMTEGTVLESGWYQADDAAILAAGWTRGTKSGRILHGDPNAPTSDDTREGEFSDFRWSGTATVDSSAAIAEAVIEAAAFGTPSDLATQSIDQASTFVLVETALGLRSERTAKINRSDTPQAFAVNFRNAMTVGQHAYNITGVEFIVGSSPAVSISAAADFLRDGGTTYHFMLTPATVGVYQVRLTPVFVSPSGGRPGDILFEVVP
jgi:hypothetical protein